MQGLTCEGDEEELEEESAVRLSKNAFGCALTLLAATAVLTPCVV